MNRPGHELRAVLDPLGAVPGAVEARRFGLGLLLVACCVSASGAVVAQRVDVQPQVIAGLAASGELAKKSERELTDAVEQAQRVALVAGSARGILVPFSALAIALGLSVLGWLLGRKASFGAYFTVAVLGLLPVGVFHVVLAMSAWGQGALSPAMAQSLLPTSLAAAWPDAQGALGRAYRAVDVFNLWSALLIGLGLAAALKLPRWAGAALGLTAYALVGAALLVGLPGLAGGGGAP